MKKNTLQSILLTIINLCIYNLDCFSQGFELNRTINWRFGHAAGINFDKNNNYQASVFTGSSGITFEGNSCMSDTDGNLLFYCNGDTLWNALHQPMLNGAGLLCDKNAKVSSQIIPRPGSSTQFFVFVNGCVADQCINGLRYSLVDMTLDNGKGGVVAGQKNILVMTDTYQGMAVTKHGNNVDYWLAYSKYFPPPQNTRELIVIPITNIGPDTSNIVVANFGEGGMNGSGRFSPDGSIFVKDSYAFYQFDKMTGQFSNQIIPNNDSIGPGSNYFTYGFEFSPNSKILYLCLVTGLGNNCIQQIDVSIYDSAAISNSIYSWQIYYGPPVLQGLGHMQLGPDGKIYVSKTGGFTDSIHIIHQPNILGAGCTFEYNAMALQRPCNFSMPIYPNYYFNNIVTSNNSLNLSDNLISIYPNPANDYITINHKFTENHHYLFYDYEGQLVLFFSGNQLIQNISTSQLPNGIYFLQITSNSKSISKKIIINH
ncbi:MAG: T9SS type A sorting domain-containing protein [Bacteroidia bacterium]|nr:T9SS type A sorting domain-containing protein [Bacteroidia bacterium]